VLSLLRIAADELVRLASRYAFVPTRAITRGRRGFAALLLPVMPMSVFRIEPGIGFALSPRLFDALADFSDLFPVVCDCMTKAWRLPQRGE